MQELDDPDVSAAQPVPGVGRSGEPGDQRPVQVEEGADTRAFRSRVHFRRGPGEPWRRLSAVLMWASH